MQPGSRRRDGAALARKDRLIAIAILIESRRAASDVRWQGRLAQFIDNPVKIVDLIEFDYPGAVVPGFDHFCSQN